MQIQSPDDRLARGLGWFSIGLGVAQVSVPRALAAAIGLHPMDRTRHVMRALGVRELASGVGILTRRRPTGWLWGRVAGDLMDLALLGWAFTRPRNQRNRLAGALSAVAGAFALDLLAGVRHSKRRRQRHAAAVTIYRTPEDVATAWAALEGQPGIFYNLSKIGEAELCPAPGGRGTEVKIYVDGGTIDATRVRNDLRRFKQVLETGEVVRSDASIHPGMHAAQPSSQKELQ